MFTVNEYKIVFKKRWQNRCTDLKGKFLLGDGRYDTVCEIWLEKGNVRMEVPRFTGIAKLHPNDRPDKLLGKKIALRKAIGVWDAENEEWSYSCSDFFNKSVRTAIWKNFWAWVATWSMGHELLFADRAKDQTGEQQCESSC